MLKLYVALRSVAGYVELAWILLCIFDDGVGIFKLAVFVNNPYQRVYLEIADISEIIHIEWDVFA